MAKLFPEYLNQGSKGPAVAVLQIILIFGGYDPGREIEVDGDYGSKTTEAVKRLQSNLGGIDVDGNFGPETREALEDFVISFDVNALEAELFVGETHPA